MAGKLKSLKMNHTRRVFITQLSLLGGVAALNRPFRPSALISKSINSSNPHGEGLVIYSTNNLYGKMDAVYNGLGGLAQAKALIKKEEIKGMILDAGGFLNGADNYDTQKGFIYAMNTMGYAAAALCNHELAQGCAHLVSLIPARQFTLVNCNHQFNGELAGMIKPYIIVNSSKFKIGITGVSSPLKGFKYDDAIQSANNTARVLKENEKCDLVICLSHLDHKQGHELIDNQKLAQHSENIDMIIGGGNKITCTNTQILTKKPGSEVILAQAAPKGLMLGRTFINFDWEKQKNGIRSKHFFPGTPPGQTYHDTFAALKKAGHMELSA